MMNRWVWTTVLYTAINVICSSQTITLISVDAAGSPGNGGSGFKAPWAIAPVSDSGTVVFLSDADNLNLVDEGVDWDVFLKEVDNDVVYVSLREFMENCTKDDCEERHADNIAFAGETIVEVRDAKPAPSDLQFLWLRPLTDSDDKKEIASGSTLFEHVKLSDNGWYLVLEANDNSDFSDDDEERQDIYRYGVLDDSLIRISGRDFEKSEDHDFQDALWPDVSNNGNRIVFSSIDAGYVDDDTNDAEDIFLWDSGSVVRVNRRFTDRQDGFGVQTRFQCRQPVISGDGARIFYTGDDAFIIESDTNESSDIFCYDVNAGTTIRVSIGTSGGEGDSDSTHPECNETGRFVVFQSNSSNFPGARDGIWQIYLYDLESSFLRCLSMDSCGNGADADCFTPSISPNGRYVTYSTAASNLIGASGGNRQVVMVDRGDGYLDSPPVAQDIRYSCQSNTTETTFECNIRLSTSDMGLKDPLTFRLLDFPEAGEGTITDRDGNGIPVHACGWSDSFGQQQLPLRFRPASGFSGVTTLTYQSGNGVGWSNEARVVIRVDDFDLGIITPVSVRAPDFPSESIATGDGASPAFPLSDAIGMSGNGRWVAFSTHATDLATGGSGVVLRDMLDEKTYSLLSVSPAFIHYPVISLNGSLIAYTAYTEVSLEDHINVHTISPQGPSPVRYVLDVDAPANLSIDASGKTLVFDTAEALIPELDTDSATDVYAWSPSSSTLSLISQGASSEQVAEPCDDSFISPDGRHVAFVTAGDFHNQSVSTTRDVWIKCLRTGVVQKIEGVSGNASGPALSWTGQFLSVDSGGSVWLLDLTKAGSSGVIAEIPLASHARIAAGGRFVYFASARVDFVYENGIVASPGGAVANAFRYDITTGHVFPLSYTASNGFADGNSYYGMLSEDGQYAVFISDSEDLSNDGNGFADVFQSDTAADDNHRPVAAAASIEGFENTTIDDISLVADDIDAQDLRYEIAEFPDFGTLGSIRKFETVHGRPAVAYTPDSDYYGVDQFSFRVRDVHGYSNEAVISIVIHEVLEPSVTITDHLIIAGGQGAGAISKTLVAVSDPDDLSGNEPERLILRLASTPMHGTIRNIDGDIIAGMVPYNTFPLSYEPVSNGVNVEAIDVFAIDSGDPGDNPSNIARLYIFSGIVEQSLSLAKGWNLVSFPLSLVQSVEPEVIFRYQNAVNAKNRPWRWDAESAAFQRASSITKKRAYWIYAMSSTVLTGLPGDPGDEADVTVADGWNLVGVIDSSGEPVFSGVEDLGGRRIWAWNSERSQFQPAGQPEFGKGYWIYQE